MSIAVMVTGVIANNQALTIVAGAMFAAVASVVGWRFTVVTSHDADHLPFNVEMLQPCRNAINLCKCIRSRPSAGVEASWRACTFAFVA
jgi:hypothetical protein